MTMAAHMATNEYYDEALRLSDLALSQLSSDQQNILQRPRVSQSSIQAFQAVVRADIEAARSDDDD